MCLSAFHPSPSSSSGECLCPASSAALSMRMVYQYIATLTIVPSTSIIWNMHQSTMSMPLSASHPSPSFSSGEVLYHCTHLRSDGSMQRADQEHAVMTMSTSLSAFHPQSHQVSNSTVAIHLCSLLLPGEKLRSICWQHAHIDSVNVPVSLPPCTQCSHQAITFLVSSTCRFILYGLAA